MLFYYETVKTFIKKSFLSIADFSKSYLNIGILKSDLAILFMVFIPVLFLIIYCSWSVDSNTSRWSSFSGVKINYSMENDLTPFKYDVKSFNPNDIYSLFTIYGYHITINHICVLFWVLSVIFCRYCLWYFFYL